MKTFIPIIAVTILFFLSSQNTVAQNLSEFKKMPPAQKAQIITDSLKRILNLSDGQYNKVYATTLAGIKRAEPVVNSNAGRMSKGMQLRSIMNDTEDQLRLVLTPAQFTLYESYREKTIAYFRQQADDGKSLF